ncbi:MAG: hypothetical protein AB7P97_19285 [Hyphomonadaceae bacterium]
MAFDDFKHAQRERLLFLDRCFTWNGRANRRDIEEQFGVSNPQAALDFKAYLERAGRWGPRYDTELKTYIAHEKHRPLVPEETLQEWESVVREGADNTFCELPALTRTTDPTIIAKIKRSLDRNLAIQIRYTSMSSGEQSQQWIAPTAFASDGARVHVRAYSFKHGEYRDYLPVRISAGSSFDTRELDNPLPPDDDWVTLVRFTLAPLKSLSPEQARAVRREFAFDGPTLKVTTRKALAFYARRRWGLDQDAARLEIVTTEYLEKADVIGEAGQ